MNKDLIIIALIILLIYLYYQQNAKEIPQEILAEINQLQNQVKHFQTLYEQRAEKVVRGVKK
jgi:hypothetical protein